MMRELLTCAAIALTSPLGLVLAVFAVLHV